MICKNKIVSYCNSENKDTNIFNLLSSRQYNSRNVSRKMTATCLIRSELSNLRFSKVNMELMNIILNKYYNRTLDREDVNVFLNKIDYMSLGILKGVLCKYKDTEKGEFNIIIEEIDKFDYEFISGTIEELDEIRGVCSIS